MAAAGACRKAASEPLVLDALGIGDLVHMVLDRALQDIEANGGLASADEKIVRAAVAGPLISIATPLGKRTRPSASVHLAAHPGDAGDLAAQALAFGDDLLPGARSYGEVPFGGAEPKSDVACPWDPDAPVKIPGHRLQYRRLYRPP